MKQGRASYFPLFCLAVLGIVISVAPPGASSAVSPPSQAKSSLTAPHTFQKGISYATWWSGQYANPGADLSLQRLAGTGATWISLVVTGYQDTPASTTIDRTSLQTPTDADLIHVIEQAHILGSKVMLKPHLDLRNEEENDWWRGHIGDDFTSEGQWNTWFASYRGFIEHYAALAESYDADQFCVGTELLGTTHRAADWRAVIAGVRALYSGPITYAALHSGEEMAITWWDAVDYIGVDAYYPLFFEPEYHPTTAELEASWLEPKQIMADLSASQGKPILLTEIGYRSHHGCAQHPWDSLAQSPLDMEEQANAYEAAFRQLYSEPWLAGIYWWTWHPDRFKSGRCDDGYSPHQKPAERVLRAWYGGDPLSANPVLLPQYEGTGELYIDGLAPAWQNWSWDVILDPSATSPVHSGAHSLSALSAPWGGVSLAHAGLGTQSFTWLEFYLYALSEVQLQVFFQAADGRQLPAAPVDDCRHLAAGRVTPGTWHRVRIPMAELNPDNHSVTRVTIQNMGAGNPVQFWLDDIRLVAGQEPAVQVFLPAAIR
jgi:hypothetical protein